MNIIKYQKVKEKDDEGEDIEKLIQYCPECQNTQFIYDYERQEVICASCSLIVRNNDLMSLKQKESEVIKYIEYLKIKRKIKK